VILAHPSAAAQPALCRPAPPQSIHHPARSIRPPSTPQGNRKVIDGMASGSAKVLEAVLKLVDAYDLYGRWVCVCVWVGVDGVDETKMKVGQRILGVCLGGVVAMRRSRGGQSSADKVCGLFLWSTKPNTPNATTPTPPPRSVAYPKHHSQDDISDIYLLPHHTRGVFVNIALQVRHQSVFRVSHCCGRVVSACVCSVQWLWLDGCGTCWVSLLLSVRVNSCTFFN